MKTYNDQPVNLLTSGLFIPEGAKRNGRGQSTRPVAVDLFCGAGGLSLGLERAGFDVKFAVDFDKHALGSYVANHPNTAYYHGDVRKLKSEDIRAAIGSQEITLVAGGPSCQGFSTHGKRDEDDSRNFLFKEFARIVGDLQPKFFLMENVKGLLAYRGGYFKKVITDAFGRSGYRVESRVLCAADYGAPQLRHRIFFIGTRLDVPISFPMPTHAPADEILTGRKPHVTVGDALSDLPLMKADFGRGDWKYATEPTTDFQRYARSKVKGEEISLHISRPLSKQAASIARHVSEGEGLRAVPPKYLPARFRKMRRVSSGALRRDCTTLYYRPSRAKPSYTITCNFRNVASGPFIHPLEDRSFSIREAARLMSFPDHYIFTGSSLPRQVGNSVPPLLGEAVGRQILKLASGSAKSNKVMVTTA